LAGIYIHIPYCKQKCSYCNFHFSTDLKSKTQITAAICREISLRKNEIKESVETIYWGGGTPSLLNGDEIQRIFDVLYQHFEIVENPEITLEANPDDLSHEKISILKSTPINRLSIGVQSFFDEDLRLMHRAHNEIEALRSIQTAQDAGFDNITIDLIYGSPTTTREMWQKNLEKALALRVPHISSYALTVEPKTALNHWIKNQKVDDIDEEKQEEQFQMLVKTLIENGFLHYEISNFGKPGYLSKHNSSYWRGIPYLGIGPSAHSYDGQNRSWNVRNNQIYLQKINQGIIPSETEHLSENERFNEMVMIRLRTMEGLSLHEVQEKFPENFLTQLLQDLQPHLDNQTVTLEDAHIHITASGLFLADGIAASLFRVEEG